MIIYIPYALDYGFNMKSKYERLTYSYAVYVFSHATLTQTAHTVSICLTITLALWRYVAVCHPNKKILFMKRTIPVIVASYIISPIVSIPIYLSLKIREFNITLNSNETSKHEDINLTIYKVYPSEMAANHQKAYLWIYSVIIKLLPCIVLTFLSLQLIRALYEAKKRKEKLKGNLSIKLLSKKKQADRTTKMLIAVLLLFLVTEFPQGILGLFSALLQENFYIYCYQKLGEKLLNTFIVHTFFTPAFSHSLSTYLRRRYGFPCVNQQQHKFYSLLLDVETISRNILQNLPPKVPKAKDDEIV